MKKLFCFILLLCGVTSCYPPRLIYALDDTCSIENDLIDIQLLKGSTTSLDAHTITSKLFIEVCNKSNSILTLNDNPKLEALVDSVTLYYELFESDTDTLPCKLEPKSKKNVFLVFKAEDSNYHLFKSTNDKNKGHFLKLHLRFDSSSRKEIDKTFSFKFVKRKRLKYEKEHW